MTIMRPAGQLWSGPQLLRTTLVQLFRRGQIVKQASEDNDEMIIADLDFDQVREVRNTWQFFRDRRPETYGQLTEL